MITGIRFENSKIVLKGDNRGDRGGTTVTGEDCFSLIALGSCLMIANECTSNVWLVQENS